MLDLTISNLRTWAAALALSLCAASALAGGGGIDGVCPPDNPGDPDCNGAVSVAEPASMLVFAAGAAGLYFIRRRRTR